MVSLAESTGREAARAEPEGLLIPLCPECGSYYIFEVETSGVGAFLPVAASGWPLVVSLVDLYACLPCGWIGNRPHHGL